jgi:hypothetical protein
MKTIFLSLLIIATLLLSSCSRGENADTENTDIKTRCIEGVTYFLFKEMKGYYGYGFMSPKFNRDGTINTCNN